MKRKQKDEDKRDCEECKHYKTRIHEYKDLPVEGCELWKCKYEPKE